MHILSSQLRAFTGGFFVKKNLQSGGLLIPPPTLKKQEQCLADGCS